MPVINILSPHLADMIAAGEVVERPASVVKELMENAFDAGAKNVIVEIRNGGTTYIRVTDDGCGMSPEDAGIAFLRHATSKLRDEAGLDSISTMGFRGEALAAISSVSKMEIVTRLKGTNEGTRLLLDAGDISDMNSYGCPEGTTVICRDLFFNTPARLKFLKSDRSESASCSSTALRCALGRPDVSVKFIRDGEEEFFSPGDGKTDSCLYALLGREEASTMFSCSGTWSDGLRLTGYVSSPAHGRGNRAHQFFFVNGRNIRSATIQAALEQAYKNTLLSGRYPSCVLYVEIGFNNVDVNVHPTKMEVRFGSEKTIFDLVYHTVRDALETEDTLASSSLAPAKAVPSGNFYKTMSIDEFRSKKEKLYHAASEPAPAQPSGPKPAVQPKAAVSFAPAKPAMQKESVPPKEVKEVPRAETKYQITLPENDFFASPAISQESQAVIPEYQASVEHLLVKDAQASEKSTDFMPEAAPVEKNVENSVQNVESIAASPYKILGEAFHTYIIIEQNGELILIDKHAAHERIIFNRLKEKEGSISSQYLLSPVTMKLSPEDSEMILQNRDLLDRLGFEIDLYGDCDFIVRGVPADISPSDVVPAIEEVCEKLKCGNSPDPSSVRDEILHTVACKAAIKAGWNTQPSELEKLAEHVLSGEIRYCPHGRPVSAVITRSDLDKLFKRIV